MKQPWSLPRKIANHSCRKLPRNNRQTAFSVLNPQNAKAAQTPEAQTPEAPRKRVFKFIKPVGAGEQSSSSSNAFGVQPAGSRYATETSKIGVANPPSEEPEGGHTHRHLLSQMKARPWASFLRKAIGDPSIVVWHSHLLSMFSFSSFSLSVSKCSFIKHFFCLFPAHLCFLFVCLSPN